ncbi:hypothetical protein [Persicirhabdus sediminis]|nr:hypothetical protein [Persicirhabdus sediminis]
MKLSAITTAAIALTCLGLTSCDKGTSDSGETTSGSSGLGSGYLGGIQLQVDLPDPMIEGTPAPGTMDLDLPILMSFPEFLVPEDSVILSAGKPVTSSDSDPIIGELSYLTDGDKESGEGYFVELMPGTQWVQVDLEQSAEIYALVLWHFHSQERVYHDVIIQASNDPEFKSGVTTLFNNDYDNSSQLGKGHDSAYMESHYGLLVDGKGTEARYIRCYSNGNTANEMNHYIELEVHGLSK